MPDTLNKQAIVNLLIDSPLREPIKINLIDIVNNTTEPDLPKVFPTIVKEIEIFQKATERRMKLAEETIAKLGGTNPTGEAGLPAVGSVADDSSEPSAAPSTPPALSVPPLDLPPMPASTPPTDLPSLPPLPPVPNGSELKAVGSVADDSSEPSAAPAVPSPLPPLSPLGGTTTAPQADEDALAEIQKELDSLKTSTADDIAAASTPAPAPLSPQA